MEHRAELDPRPQLIARLRDDLGAAQFTVERLQQLLGDEASAALRRGHRVSARRALDRAPGFDAAAVLARVFVLGFPAPGADIAIALPTLGLEGASELGLLQPSGFDCEPLIDLRPYSFSDSWGEAEWWIASDLGEVALGGALPEDHVLGVGGASLTLAGLQLGRASARSLDLGTGCGIQAMHASRFSGWVIATDISPRALTFARLNAELNGISNIEFRLGSLFDPVAEERFDYVVSNPPFVITPRVEGVPSYEYRDGGRVGDAIVSEVIEGVAKYLRPGGVAQLLGNWEYRTDGAGPTSDGLARIESWIDRAGLDGWVIERERQDAAAYAETWIRDGGTRTGPDSDLLESAWLDDFEARGVSAVGFGYVLLRSRPDGPARLRRFERVDGPASAGIGAHLSSCLEAFDWQAELDDDSLARARVVVAPDVTEERHYWPGDEHPAAMTLRQGGGFGRSYPLGTALAAVLGACDGELSIAAIGAAVADLLEVRGDELLAEVLPAVREFVTVGILRPAEAS